MEAVAEKAVESEVVPEKSAPKKQRNKNVKKGAAEAVEEKKAVEEAPTATSAASASFQPMQMPQMGSMMQIPPPPANMTAEQLNAYNQQVIIMQQQALAHYQ